MFSKLRKVHKLDNIAFTEKDNLGIKENDNVLSMQLIMECSKEQRKGYEIEVSMNEESEVSTPCLAKRQVEWEQQIETLNLTHNQIGIISNLELFVNLRKLNLMDNNI